MIKASWLDAATCLASPNCNDRPDGAAIDLLVIHNISLPPQHFGGGHVQQLFLNTLDPGRHPYFATIADLAVSSHLYIERDGELTQFVPLDKRAWHAGVSAFGGRPNCNDFSIGIELEGTDDTPYTDKQYCRLVEVSAVIMNTYPRITLERIVGHCDIAPGRKTDPGASFDWQRYKTSLAKHFAGEP